MIKKNYIKQLVYGFIKAIKRFNVEYDVKLPTYAVPYILGEIKRFIRDDGPIKVSRSIKELGSKIRDVQREYLAKNGKDIKIFELAKILNVKPEEITIAIDATKPIDSIDEEAYNQGENETKISKISDNKDDFLDLINKMTLKKIISELNKREQNIIALRYYKGKTQTEVAKMLGISQVQVSRIEKKTLLEMRQKIVS